VTLTNRAGPFVMATRTAFAAAAANATWDASVGFATDLTNQPGAESWPIVGVSFILVPVQPTDPARTKAVLAFFDYSFKNGIDAVTKLDYVPLPAALVDQIRTAWSGIKAADGTAVWQ
jgi:phosphate transport system substrate-binding protein